MENKLSRRLFLSMASAFSTGAVSGVALADSNPVTNRNLKGKVALITGATSGIGEATAIVLARRGAKVMFCGRREKLGLAVEKSIRAAGGEATYFKADVRNEDEVRNFVNATKSKYGGLHIAFNNAGIAPGPIDVHKLNFSDVMDVMQTNFFGVLYAMKYEIPLLLESGGGVITNCGSYSADHAHSGYGAYTSSKHALNGLTKTAALELARKGVIVNSINPYAVRTPMMERRAKFLGVQIEDMASRRPNGKMSSPEDVAELVAYLSSADNRIVHGQTIDLSMGENIDF